MKREDIQKAVALNNELISLESQLDDLKSENMHVEIYSIGLQKQRIQLVGVGKSYEHNFSIAAEDFINRCINILQMKIESIERKIAEL